VTALAAVVVTVAALVEAAAVVVAAAVAVVAAVAVAVAVAAAAIVTTRLARGGNLKFELWSWPHRDSSKFNSRVFKFFAPDREQKKVWKECVQQRQFVVRHRSSHRLPPATMPNINNLGSEFPNLAVETDLGAFNIHDVRTPHTASAPARDTWQRQVPATAVLPRPTQAAPRKCFVWCILGQAYSSCACRGSRATTVAVCVHPPSRTPSPWGRMPRGPASLRTTHPPQHHTWVPTPRGAPCVPLVRAPVRGHTRHTWGVFSRRLPPRGVVRGSAWNGAFAVRNRDKTATPRTGGKPVVVCWW